LGAWERRQSRNQNGLQRAPRTLRELFTGVKGSIEQAARLRQRLLRVQDFGLTRAENHSEIGTYLGVCLEDMRLYVKQEPTSISPLDASAAPNSAGVAVEASSAQ